MFGGHFYSRHPRKAFPHISNNVHNHTTMFLHPAGVHCVCTATISHLAEHFTKYPESKLLVCNYIPAWQQWNVPVRLVSITAFQPFEDMFSAGLENWPPPLFTRKSILPYCFSTDDTRSFTCLTQTPSYCRLKVMKFMELNVKAAAPHFHSWCYTGEEWQKQNWIQGSVVSSPGRLPGAFLCFYWRWPHCSLKGRLEIRHHQIIRQDLLLLK